MASCRLRLTDVTFEAMASNAINWSKCCICEKNNDEDLICPALNPVKSLIHSGYKTFAENLIEFNSIGALPLGFNFQKLNEGGGILETLVRNKARWHKNCAVRFNKTRLERAKKRKHDSYNESHESKPLEEFERNLSNQSTFYNQIKEEKDTCFVCRKKGSIRRPLSHISSFKEGTVSNICADITNNINSQTYPESDNILIERKYHLKCYANLKNSQRLKNIDKEDEINYNSTCESMAFASVARYIRDTLQTTQYNCTETVLKMPELVTIYKNSLANFLQVDSEDLSNIHTTRLRERIINHFPELKAQLSGREYVLYRDGANVFRNVYNLDDDAVACERFIKQIRKDITHTKVTFNGHLNCDRQSETVPSALLALVNYILYGYSPIENATKATLPALTISQLIVFNYNETYPKGTIIRHKKSHEPPFPLYMGLSVYGRTRNNAIIESMHDRGISISPSRIKELTAGLGRLVIQRAQQEGVLCPSNLLHGLFVIGAYDNIDHNYTSTSSESSFHGTAISVFQIPAKGENGISRQLSLNVLSIDETDRKMPELPESYSVVKSITLPSKQPIIPKRNGSICNIIPSSAFGSQWKKEQEWLDHVISEKDNASLDYSWAAFHASKEDTSSFELARNSLLPLFNESSCSPSMLRHAMEQLKKITTFLNPGQIPVICVDQPLFALTKSIQWNWPELYGESNFVVMFAPFHIEQAFLKVLGQILQGSGWTSIVANSGIKTEAGAEATLKVIHVTKARLIHQITAAALFSLLKDAFAQESRVILFEEWIEERRLQCPTFRFWFLVLNLEILLLSFVRSIRLGNYKLFIQTLKEITPWFFLMDHCHYARWLPVHIKDLEELKDTAPRVHKYFCNGQFVIHKTNNPFSALAVDQAHEQNNAIIKGDGGAIGLLQDPAMLRRWMLAGPELVSIINEFEAEYKMSGTKQRVHHEQYPAFQKRFKEKTQALKKSFLQFNNPFEVTSTDLLVWDTKVVINAEGVKSLVCAEEKAIELYKKYVEERLDNTAKVSIFAPIRKTGTKIFSSALSTLPFPMVSTLRNDIELFSRAFIISQSRKLDLDKFFEYENTSTPPSLSSNGVVRACQKSQLTKVLEEMIDSPQFEEFCDTLIYDGAALVHALPPKTSRTFKEYCQMEFKSKILNDIERLNADRVHISWDLYTLNSLKRSLRERRGVGIRRQVAEETLLPKNWNDFLACDENKTQLFNLLGVNVLSLFDKNHIITEIDGKICSSRLNHTSINGVKCRHQEEADGRIFLHAKDSVEHGAKKILIFTVDTDVLVLAVSYFMILKSAGLQELWLLFGTGKFQRYISINAIVDQLGADKALALRGFHAFTGSDVTSSFAMKGKKTAWNIWKSFPEATLAFQEISIPQEAISDQVFNILEKFVVLLYYKASQDFSVNRVRKILFAKGRNLQSLPPTKDALKQHCLRSAYQAGQVWGQACSVEAFIPEPEGWGWTMDKGVWRPIWSYLPSIWEACRELVKCSCAIVCHSRCSCAKAKMPCTLLCSNCNNGQKCGNKYNKEE